MSLLFCLPGGADAVRMIAALICLAFTGAAFTGWTIWLAAQTIVAFRKDASRKRVARHAVENKRSSA